MRDLPADFFGIAVGSLGIFDVLSSGSRVTTILADSENDFPVMIEYPYGNGRVFGSTYALEYMHERSGLSESQQTYFSRVIDYLTEEFIYVPNWVEHPNSKIVVEPNQTKTVDLKLNASDVDEGKYEAYLYTQSNIRGVDTEISLAELSLDVRVVTSLDRRTSDIPQTVELSQNYPNPFNPTTTINYGIPNAGSVQLVVYNVLGQKIQTIVDTNQEAGRYVASFNASALSSGLYFYQLHLNGTVVDTKRMMLIK